MATEKQILSERDVEAEFGLTISYLRRARRHKQGPRFMKIGKLIRYRRDEIDKFLRESEVKTA